MKKLFTLFAVAALAFAAQANELTVCDNGEVGSDAWNHLPVFGYWFDAEGMTQQIYPAEMLADMAGGKITALKFYSAASWEGYESYTIAFYGADIALALKEVEETSYDEDAPSMIGGATVVAVTEAEYGGVYLTFELDEPFEYNGGNLLVEAYWDGTGTYGATYFVGEAQENYCSYYAFDYYDEWLEQSSQILNKVTFTYEEGTPEPTEKTADPNVSAVPGDHIYTITITNNANDPDAVIYVRINDGEYEVYTEPIVLTEFGEYWIYTYALTDGKLPSNEVALKVTIDENTQPELTAVSELNGQKAVAGVRYFNMAGQEMQQAEGLTIVVTTYTDGTSSAVKVVK